MKSLTSSAGMRRMALLGLGVGALVAAGFWLWPREEDAATAWTLPPPVPVAPPPPRVEERPPAAEWDRLLAMLNGGLTDSTLAEWERRLPRVELSALDIDLLLGRMDLHATAAPEDRERKERLLWACFARIKPDEFVPATGVLKQRLDGQKLEQFAAHLVIAAPWSGDTPLQIADQFGPGTVRTAAVRAAMTSTSAETLESRMDWAQLLDFPDERDEALLALREVTAGLPSEKVAGILSRSPGRPPEVTEAIAAGYGAGLALNLSCEEALAQCADLGPARAAAQRGVIEEASRKDPRATFAFVLSNGLAKVPGWESAVGAMAREAPREAAETLTNPARVQGADSADAAAVLVGEWMEQDSMAASAWVDALADVAMRTAAAEALIRKLEDSGDVESAAAWRASLPAAP